MSLRLLFLTASFIGGVAFAQSRLKPDINAETPEGKLLQEIGQTQEDAKRLELVDKFLAAYGSHNSVPWAIGQALASAQKLNQHDKVMADAAKLLAVDASDAEMAYAGLQAAAAKSDADQTIKWANSTIESCQKTAASPEPKDEAELERWKYKISFCKPEQTPKRAEYELVTLMARSQEPAARVKLLDALAALNPKSEYLAQAPTYYFTSYRQMNQNEKALAVATKAAESQTADEDMLLMLANNAFEKKDQPGAIKYADQITALLQSKPLPAGMDQAAWDKKKGQTLGAGLWLKGMTLAGQSKWKETDSTLREALPHLQGGNTELLSHALFNVGLANYKMGNLNDALKFMQDCAAFKGSKQAEAVKNAAVIRQQGGGAPAPKKAGGKK